jgi:hypothetical protein
MSQKPRRNLRRWNWETVREIALALPEVEESTSYGTPAFKVRGKLFARLKEDGSSIVVRIDEADRPLRLRADPFAFYITEHYANYPWILVRLPAVVRDDLADLVCDAWRLRAPGRLAAEYEGVGPDLKQRTAQSRRDRRK